MGGGEATGSFLYGAASRPREYTACQFYPSSGGEGRAKKGVEKKEFHAHAHTHNRQSMFRISSSPATRRRRWVPTSLLLSSLVPMCLCLLYAHAFSTSTGNRWSREYGARKRKPKTHTYWLEGLTGKLLGESYDPREVHGSEC